MNAACAALAGLVFLGGCNMLMRDAPPANQTAQYENPTAPRAAPVTPVGSTVIAPPAGAAIAPTTPPGVTIEAAPAPKPTPVVIQPRDVDADVPPARILPVEGAPRREDEFAE